MQYSEENTVPVHIVVLASVMFVGYALRNYLISAFANFVTEHVSCFCLHIFSHLIFSSLLFDFRISTDVPHQRGIFVTIFVLPISVLFDVFWYTRNK
jgi:hypothetical protein